jgi:hypothetical protein
MNRDNKGAVILTKLESVIVPILHLAGDYRKSFAERLVVTPSLPASAVFWGTCENELSSIGSSFARALCTHTK